jgi:hypothetical protein
MIFGFSRMKVVSMAYNDAPGSASRPFDRGRDGFVLGEGAWMVVLEREDRARARGARVYASIDATDRRATRTTESRWRRTDERSCGDRPGARAMGRSRDEIGYVSYHGTSTVLNDAVESRCVREVFGGHAERLAWLLRKIDDRAPAGCERIGRRRRRPLRWRGAISAHDQPTILIPLAISTSSRTPAARPTPRLLVQLPSASDQRTARWSLERRGEGEFSHLVISSSGHRFEILRFHN